jgi:hypothetical protein
MKKNLQSRLSRYTAAATAVVGAVTGANAQIVYTDVNPDETHDPVNNGATEFGLLDLNNDQILDFYVVSKDTTTPTPTAIKYTMVAPYGALGNAVAGDVPSGYNYAFAMTSGTSIDAATSWIIPASSGALSMALNVDGAFPYPSYWANGVTDKYLGLKFFLGADAHYGWARLDVTADGDVFTIKDYAYNATAGGAILAGQMVGLTENVESTLHFVNQNDNTVKIMLNGLTDGTITVVSASGQTVSTGKTSSDEYIVNLNGLTAGVYVINAEFAAGKMTKKVIVH